MEQKDFILREIEKIGAMLRMLIRRRIEQKDRREEEEETEQLFDEIKNEAGIDLENILNHTIKDFPDYFNINKGFNLENTELLADFLVQLSDSSTIQNPYTLRRKAIEIYEFVDTIGKTYSMERAAKIKNLTLKGIGY